LENIMSWHVRLRDLIFLGLIVALAAGWYVQCRLDERERSLLVQERLADAEEMAMLRQTIEILKADANVASQTSLAKVRRVRLLALPRSECG
jgi:hypothetical protein